MANAKATGLPKAENRVEVNSGLKITVGVTIVVYTLVALLFALNSVFHFWQIPPS